MEISSYVFVFNFFKGMSVRLGLSPQLPEAEEKLTEYRPEVGLRLRYTIPRFCWDSNLIVRPLWTLVSALAATKFNVVNLFVGITERMR